MRTRSLTLLLVLMLTACVPLATPTPLVATPTPTPEHLLMCTPPPCATDETYACGKSDGNCPGGCGTICVKKTDVTAAPSGEPHLNLSVSATQIKVGELLTLTAQPIDLGLPYYSFSAAQKADFSDAEFLAQVTYENNLTPADTPYPLLAFVSAEGAMQQAELVLRASAAGTVYIGVSATGEVFSNGAFMSGGGSGEPVMVEIAP